MDTEEKQYARLALAGLLSMDVRSAKVESAIISWLAPDSHSNNHIPLPTSFTSSTPITCAKPCQSTSSFIELISPQNNTHPYRPHPILIQPLLQLPIHSLQVPPHQLVLHIERDALPLRHHARRKAREVLQIARVEEGVGVVLGDEQAGEDVAGLRGLVGEGADGLGGGLVRLGMDMGRGGKGEREGKEKGRENAPSLPALL